MCYSGSPFESPFGNSVAMTDLRTGVEEALLVQKDEVCSVKAPAHGNMIYV